MLQALRHAPQFCGSDFASTHSVPQVICWPVQVVEPPESDFAQPAKKTIAQPRITACSTLLMAYACRQHRQINHAIRALVSRRPDLSKLRPEISSATARKPCRPGPTPDRGLCGPSD
jgi:hypothetical protein